MRTSSPRATRPAGLGVTPAPSPRFRAAPHHGWLSLPGPGRRPAGCPRWGRPPAPDVGACRGLRREPARGCPSGAGGAPAAHHRAALVLGPHAHRHHRPQVRAERLAAAREVASQPARDHRQHHVVDRAAEARADGLHLGERDIDHLEAAVRTDRSGDENITRPAERRSAGRMATGGCPPCAMREAPDFAATPHHGGVSLQTRRFR